MKQDSRKGPSCKQHRRLKPWVVNTIEALKVIWKCVVRLACVIILFTVSCKMFAVPTHTELKSDLQQPIVEMVEAEEAPKIEGSHEDIINRLVHDVDTGKAGNGDARKEYLGEYYDEVQKIVNEKYKEETKAVYKDSSAPKVTGSKAEYQAYAHELVISYGWSESDFNALVKLWTKESDWDPSSHNKSSGAHGIPQALPASKMASYGDDYMTSYKTQIQWGLNYIKNRYGSPTNAWAHWCNKGWY